MINLEVHSIATDSDHEKFFVVLTGREEGARHWLPVRIDPRDAVSIATELEQQSAERPGTHDLIMKSVEELNASIERVQIHRDQQRLVATIYLDRGPAAGDEELLELDARPSDALALAVRSGCDIQVDPELLRESPWENDLEQQVRNRHPSDEVTRIQLELQNAVEAEEYERAGDLKSQLRDALRRHEESVELEEGVEEELERAYRGESGGAGEEDPGGDEGEDREE